MWAMSRNVPRKFRDFAAPGFSDPGAICFGPMRAKLKRTFSSCTPDSYKFPPRVAEAARILRETDYISVINVENVIFLDHGQIAETQV